jgi:hypothetical protein
VATGWVTVATVAVPLPVPVGETTGTVTVGVAIGVGMGAGLTGTGVAAGDPGWARVDDSRLVEDLCEPEREAAWVGRPRPTVAPTPEEVAIDAAPARPVDPASAATPAAPPVFTGATMATFTGPRDARRPPFACTLICCVAGAPPPSTGQPLNATTALPSAKTKAAPRTRQPAVPRPAM